MVLVIAACGGPATLGGFDTTEIQVGDQRLTVSVAETSDQRARGLQEVEVLPAGVDGMLFVYEFPVSGSYHMRNVVIPLDIWWFDQDGQLIGSNEMEPCGEEPCVSYGSPGPIMWALETPVGDFELDGGARLSTVENP